MGRTQRAEGARKRPQTSRLPRRGGYTAAVTAVPSEQANRKCPYCSAERNTNSHPTEAATLRGPQGALWRRGRRAPGPVTPTSRALTCPPQRPAARSSLRASRDTTWPGPAGAPAARRGLHAPHASLHCKPGEGASHRVPGGLGTSPDGRVTESSPKRPRSRLRAFQERRRPSPRLFAARHPLLGCHYL